MTSRTSQYAKAVLTPCLLSLLVAQAYAQDSGSAEATAPTLNTVVVTATASEVDIKDAPASISVITREEIERQPVYDLGALLSKLPGVSGGLSPTGDQSKIKLRGLPDGYTLILVDGRRQGSSANTHYRANLGRQDLNWIAPEMIERIEIVRGPMSSLYGSDAMGGVINIITRKIPKKWGGSVSASTTKPESSQRGDANQMGFNIAGPLSDRVGLRLGGSITRQNPDETTDGVSGNAAGGFRQENYNARLDWALTPEQSMSFEASHGVQRSMASAARNASGKGPAVSAFGASKLVRNGFGASHEGRWDFGKTRIDLYHNSYDNKLSSGQAAAEDTTLEGRIDKPFKFAGIEQLLTVGAQWKHEELINTDTIGTVPVDYDGNVVSGAKLSGSTAALFAENQLFLSEQLALTLGARYDHHEKFGNHLSPRAYVVYRPAEAWTVKGGVSKGFRAPSLKEHSPGAATQSGGNGCRGLAPMGWTSASGGCYMAGNPDLVPETSLNTEVGVGFARGVLDLGLTYFHTDFRNKIDYQPLGFFQGYWWTKMQNVQKARTRGLEGTATLPLASNITWRNNLTYMLEAKNLTTGASLLSTPELSWFSAVGWQVNNRLYTELAAQYTGKQLHGGTAFVKAYTTYDLSLTYQASDALKISAGLQNLTEEGPRADGATNYYVPSRRFFVGLSNRF
ncbi:TonB-dependent receptor domain-containing protein [Hydrogenophaga palleronii]|uniref:TonB-dependent receptor domain-containing protein n=1 Tax=Hydrogenophaga palleronii TaxID=65655 RepID=UPI000A6B8062|nr:TonB-dependent receptor [Hydrogenophaga palleronii]